MSTPRAPQQGVLTTGSVASEVSLLFRTKRVSEIRAIESNIRVEADDKSESLRELLGTRYKDLLRAADEMHTIRDACTVSVRDSLREMAQSASELREHFLRKGAPSSPLPMTDDLERRKTLHVVGSKLKHIVDSPEVLYAHLESGNIYEAAVRYSLASGNYLELTNTSGIEGVASRFAERRWRQVEIFKAQILSSAEKKLVNPGLGSNAYSKVFASLVILGGNDRDILGVLDGMLASRTGWIMDENGKNESSVAARIRNIAQIVRECISCGAKMFWCEDSGVGALLADVDPEGATELKRVQEDGSLNAAYLTWIKTVEEWLVEHGANILSTANTSRVLADTLIGLEDEFSSKEWPEECRSVLKQQTSFVFDIFKPFISERAGKVASESVQRAVDTVLSDIDEIWSDMGTGSHAGKLIWSAVSNQAVGWNSFANDPSIPVVSSLDSSSGEEVDVARTLGGSGQASSVVNTFESSLQEAVNDVTILTQRIPSVSEAFDESVRRSLPRVLENLQTRLDSIPVTFSDDATSKAPSYEHVIEQSLFVARTATSLGTATCVRSAYYFAKALLEGATTVGKPGPRDHSGKIFSLAEFCDTAEKVSCAGYKVWANRVCIALNKDLYSNLIQDRVLNIAMGWASSSARGTDLSSVASENGEGAVRYPTASSTAAVKFMSGACNSANRAGGFALPLQAIRYLREEMSRAAAVSYSKAHAFYTAETVQEESKDASQAGDLNPRCETAVTQMLFDVSVLQILLGNASVSGNVGSKDSLKFAEQKMQSSIDPIDLAAGRKSLQDSVSTYVSRTSILFGSIGRIGNGSTSSANRPPTTSAQTTASNLVSLARTVPRFTYLPAPMPSTYSSAAGGAAGLNAKAALGLLRSEASTASGSAFRKREDTSVAGYASKVSESVGRFGRGFFESLTRKVG